MSEKEHLSVVFAGHVDSGKSTTVGRLIFELGGLPEREMEKLKAEAERLGKGTFAFAFYLDRQKEERERGVTISCTGKEFFTEKFHYTVIDAPGHRDFIKNLVKGSSIADAAILIVPADGNFTTAIARGDPRTGEVQGQTRHHARLLNLIGVKQLCICVNKMDSDTAGYGQARYEEISVEMKRMLTRVGWKRPFVDKGVPVIPLSGWKGDNLIAKSGNMGWWNGQDVMRGKEKLHVETLYEVLDKFFNVPARNEKAPMRLPVEHVFQIKGVGSVISGRVEQGVVKPGEDVVFLPSGASGKVFTVEMHHSRAEAGNPGDVIGVNVKGLEKSNMPRAGDVMIYKSDTTLKVVREFEAQVQTLDLPGKDQGAKKPGWAPIGIVRTGQAPCSLKAITWKMGKETNGKKAESPADVKAGQVAQCTFSLKKPMVIDTFKNCEGLSRIAFFEANNVMMLGKVVSVGDQPPGCRSRNTTAAKGGSTLVYRSLGAAEVWRGGHGCLQEVSGGLN